MWWCCCCCCFYLLGCFCVRGVVDVVFDVVVVVAVVVEVLLVVVVGGGCCFGGGDFFYISVLLFLLLLSRLLSVCGFCFQAGSERPLSRRSGESIRARMFFESGCKEFRLLVNGIHSLRLFV
ncbi:unnamed protein product [Polarella glacialis]|uniref:Uncharacterized protein n=1 Tax=Polarella glacialis TaxID=89957 RepID=A0A813LNU3_POLGL|nr:unnamed protein product [Polarella glacialis]